MDNKFTCIIIDDEQDAVELLTGRIMMLCDNIEIAGTYNHWQDALNAMRKNKCDLLFIDISMPGKSGFELLKLVPSLDAEIIFVTAHDNFALNAFAFSASGYILKPIDDSELLAAINKAVERLNNKFLAHGGRVVAKRATDKIRIPNNHGIDYVNVSDIIYLESKNKCTVLVTQDYKYTSSSNIGSFKYLVDEHNFFQVHRSFIINLNCIHRYESSGLLIMQDKKEVPISRGSKHEFLKLFYK
jgi:two-component system, LytTR family, response regulator